ncbi:bifunctional diguanylate cyclase/phosphodiesterase [Pseudoruegeria sp. HB172150]|uniref:putative bifunctional diguanylate cyclase/phosphodiesterase n=1 Tax=Pseudoruegeria sp. HB172150 TaxID=2721164 RepID=UPI001555FA16|nr:EAL domain-containing protein [Pseudoruegeria sp. HB172150]
MDETTQPTLTIPVALVEELSGATSIEQVLAISARWLPEIYEADAARLNFVDEHRVIDQFSFRNGRVDLSAEKNPIPPDSPRGRVLSSGTPMHLDADSLAREPDRTTQRLYDSGMRSCLIVPMRNSGQTVGVVGLVRRSRTAFTAQQTRRLTASASWIAGQARLMQQLRANARLAETDPLTGLANRVRLMRVLDGPGALHLPDARGRVVGVLHLDLDHFKEINDRFGHEVGDLLLRHVAGCMQADTAPTDLVARIGGDEFIVVTRSDLAGQHISGLAARLSARLAEPVQLAGRDLCCSASIGLALAEPKDNAERLIANADIALYEVKRNGRNGVRAFCKAMREAHEARRALLTDLRAAVAAERFDPYFQPVIDLRTGDLAALELLARWQHPERGTLGPTTFLDIAQDAGLTDRIDAIVRRKGLKALAGLRAAGWAVPGLACNCSAQTMADPELADTLRWEVEENRLAPADLTLEVKESLLQTEGALRTEQTITRLLEFGFPVEIDEFGTGRIPMHKLQRLRIGGLKLRPGMTAQLPGDCSETLLRAVLAMAAELSLTVTVKSVESGAEVTRLKGLKCHRVQGYAVAPPMDRDRLLTYLRDRGPAPALAAG